MTDEVTEEVTEAEDYAQGWRPAAGDRVVGTVVDIAATDMGYGIYPIVTLKAASGEVAIHAFHTVLRKELARRKPKIGDELDITYLGKKDGGNYGRGYDSYRVRSDKDVAGYDWSRELGGDDDQPDIHDDDVPIQSAPVPAPEPAATASPEPSLGEKFGDEPPF